MSTPTESKPRIYAELRAGAERRGAAQPTRIAIFWSCIGLAAVAAVFLGGLAMAVTSRNGAENAAPLGIAMSLMGLAAAVLLLWPVAEDARSNDEVNR